MKLEIMKDYKYIWVIVRDTNVCHGQGEFATEPVLAFNGYDVKATYPAFNANNTIIFQCVPTRKIL